MAKPWRMPAATIAMQRRGVVKPDAGSASPALDGRGADGVDDYSGDKTSEEKLRKGGKGGKAGKKGAYDDEALDERFDFGWLVAVNLILLALAPPRQRLPQPPRLLRLRGRGRLRFFRFLRVVLVVVFD